MTNYSILELHCMGNYMQVYISEVYLYEVIVCILKYF